MASERTNRNQSRNASKAASHNRHQRTRTDHAGETAEDYVEAIATLGNEEGQCRLIELARHFGVSHVTVNKILARLSREGLVETIPYAPVKLTETGKRLAEASRRRHEVVVAFLIALGVKPITAEVDAEGIEHHVSRETLDRMKQFTLRHENANREA